MLGELFFFPEEKRDVVESELEEMVRNRWLHNKSVR